jgi:hypothetical protein
VMPNMNMQMPITIQPVRRFLRASRLFIAVKITDRRCRLRSAFRASRW